MLAEVDQLAVCCSHGTRVCTPLSTSAVPLAATSAGLFFPCRTLTERLVKLLPENKGKK